VFETVTVTLAVEVLPEVSVTLAVIVWEPFERDVVLREYDQEVVPAAVA
jgi:hypothetical protein